MADSHGLACLSVVPLSGYVNALTLNTAYQAPSGRCCESRVTGGPGPSPCVSVCAYGCPPAHVTGMVAQASKFTARGDGMNLMRYAVSYGCFLLGAMTSGVVVQHEAFYLGRMYGRVLLLLSAIWGVALIVESHFDRSASSPLPWWPLLSCRRRCA